MVLEDGDVSRNHAANNSEKLFKRELLKRQVQSANTNKDSAIDVSSLRVINNVTHLKHQSIYPQGYVATLGKCWHYCRNEARLLSFQRETWTL